MPDGLPGPISADQDPPEDTPGSAVSDDSASISPETPQPSDKTTEKRIRDAQREMFAAKAAEKAAKTEADYWRSVANGKTTGEPAEPEDPAVAYYQQRWLIAEDKQARQTYGDEIADAVGFYDEALARARDPRTGIVPPSAKAQALIDAMNFLVGPQGQPVEAPAPPVVPPPVPSGMDSNRSDVSPDLDLQRIKAEAEQKKNAIPYIQAQIERLWGR